jgi:hypothetical protein
MLVQKKSILTMNFPRGLTASLRVSGDFHEFEQFDSTLIFCNSSLLHIFIDGYSSLKTEDTKSALEKIRNSVGAVLGDVAYVRSNGDELRTMNPVSALAAFSMMGSDYLPALVSLDALAIFRRRYRGKFIEQLPEGWSLDGVVDS